MKVCLLWCCVCMQCIWELCCFNVSSKGTLSCTVTLPSGLIDRAHIKAERESNTFKQEVRGGAQPRLLSKNPACFPVFCFLACRVQKSDLLCILEKSLGEVRGRPWSWPLQWPRKGKQTPRPLFCQMQRPESRVPLMSLHGWHLLLPGCQHLVKGVPADGSSVGAEAEKNVSKIS